MKHTSWYLLSVTLSSGQYYYLMEQKKVIISNKSVEFKISATLFSVSKCHCESENTSYCE